MTKMTRNCPNCGHSFETEVAPGLEEACPRCMVEFLANAPSENADPAMADAPLQPGMTFKGMEILAFLGRGGMGFVYKARQTRLDRTVALKIMKQDLAADSEFRSRFDREAKALAALNHPNVVQIFDVGHEDDLFFLTMEYVEGVSLREVLSTQTLSPEKALRYVPQICDALEYAHERGVVHRDIKPENILIDTEGNLKIADFGLAKMTVDPTHPTQSVVTVTGRNMGTPHYMAPEQCENMGSVDHRADIYSLGVVLYEMLTGELPIGRFPVPSERVQVDVKLDEVVLKALEKDPHRRYQRASELRNEVTGTGVSPASARPAQADSAGTRLSILALCGALGLPTALVVGLFSYALTSIFLRSYQAGQLASLLGLAAAVVGVILSIAGLVVIKNNPTRLHGEGAAKFGIVFPLGLFVMLFCQGMVRVGGGPEWSGGVAWYAYCALAVVLTILCFRVYLRCPIWSMVLMLCALGGLLTLQHQSIADSSRRMYESQKQFDERVREMEAVDRHFDQMPDSISSDDTERPLKEFVQFVSAAQTTALSRVDLMARLGDMVDPAVVNALIKGSNPETVIRPKADNKKLLEPSEVLPYLKRMRLSGFSSGMPGDDGDPKSSNAIFVSDTRFSFDIPVRYIPKTGWRLGKCDLIDAAILALIRNTESSSTEDR